MYKLGILLAS